MHDTPHVRTHPPVVQLELPWTPLPDAGECWLATHVAATRNADGRRRARSRFATYVLAWFGRVPLGALTGDAVRAFGVALAQRWGLRPRTIARVLADLRGLLRWAARTGLVVASPFARPARSRHRRAITSGASRGCEPPPRAPAR
jgi:hypothetical protein